MLHLLLITMKISAVVKMTTHITGKSQQEREGYSNDDGAVSFLLLPIVWVIAGQGERHVVVTDSQLFHDDDNAAAAADDDDDAAVAADW